MEALILPSCFATKNKNVFLAIAVIYVKNKNGSLIKARVVLDSGNEVSDIFCKNIWLG